MRKISSAVEAEVRALFLPQDAEIAIAALAMMKEPSPNRRMGCYSYARACRYSYFIVSLMSY